MEGETFTPLLTMIIVQLVYAISNILSKVALNSGMHPLIHVAYRQIFATASLVPLAYFMERKILPKMTRKVFLLILLCSILGISLPMITYYIGLKYSTPTIATALMSTSPAITFILAILFRLEKVRLKSKVGLVKAMGTATCVGGTLLLALYHGPLLGLGRSPIHWRYLQSIGANTSTDNNVNLLLGPLMVIISAIALALWLIVQTKVNQMYAAPYSIQALMSLMGSVQCISVALCVSHKASKWSLANTIRLVSVLYSGIICSALGMCAISWCINKKGPVYVAVFNPLMAMFLWLCLAGDYLKRSGILESLGSALIVLGLYGVIWAKKRETMMSINKVRDNNTEDEDNEVERARHETPMSDLESTGEKIVGK